MYANTPILPGPTYTGRPVNVYRITDLILAAPEGITVHASTAQPYTGDGILVALDHKFSRETVGDWQTPQLRRHLVREWVEWAAPAVTVVSSPRRYFGAWWHQGTLYLDVVEAFSSAEEDRAVAAGRARGQLAVWHNGRRELIYTSDAIVAA